MRTHGWDGDPPSDDAEARRRVLDAAARCVDRAGAADTTLSDVATELGVTRQTVYRYVASTEDLFTTLAVEAADEFIDRIVAVMRPHDDVADAVVAGLAYTITAIPRERYLALLLRSGDGFARGVISDEAMTFGRQLLDRTHLDWEALGWDDGDLDELVEVQLRLIQSLVLDPATPDGTPRGPDDLRAFLGRWLAPALTRTAGVPLNGTSIL